MVIFLDPRKYNLKKIWLTISQVNGVTDPLRAVSQKPEEKLMEFINSNKYQFVVDLMTVANPVSGRFGVVEVDDMLEKQEVDLFLRIDLALAIVDGCHHGFSIQKLAGSAEPRAECASQPFRMTLIEAPGSQLFTDHE